MANNDEFVKILVDNSFTYESDLQIDYKIKYDAIFVLTGGVTKESILHPWTKRRLLVAQHIYQNLIQKPKIICTGGGSYHTEPITTKNGFIAHEATVCSEFLIKANLPPKDIYREWGSYDTIANGYFSFANFIVPMDFKTCIIITSDFHMTRTKIIFNWINSLFDKSINILYVSASDKGLDATKINLRTKRELESTANMVNKIIPKLTTLKEFTKWFYEDHKAYCSSLNLLRKAELTDEEKESY